MELNPPDSSTDTLLSAKIDDASSDVSIRCGPSLRRETLTETFWPDHLSGMWRHHRHDRLILSRYPVANIGSVTLDGVVVDPSLYRFDGDTGQLYALDSSGYPAIWCFGKSTVIVYDAGYLLPGQANANLPASLEAAAIELISSYWSSRGRDPLLKSEEAMGVARFDYWVGAIGQSGELPPGVTAKISPYRRVLV